jgi:hypothetical protein
LRDQTARWLRTRTRPAAAHRPPVPQAQALGAWGHLAGAAYKEIVIEDAAQSIQGGAHGRLAQTDALACTCRMPLGHQGIEDQQQVQIDRRQIHAINYNHTNIRFCKSPAPDLNLTAAIFHEDHSNTENTLRVENGETPSSAS